MKEEEKAKEKVKNKKRKGKGKETEAIEKEKVKERTKYTQQAQGMKASFFVYKDFFIPTVGLPGLSKKYHRYGLSKIIKL